MTCAYCGQPLSPPGAFCGSCGRPQPEPSLPERLHYSGPGHAQIERDLASIVASIVAQPGADHHLWMEGFDDWKPWHALPQLSEAVERAQAKQAEAPEKVARYVQTVEELLGDGSHDEWKLSELQELRSHLGITEETHSEILAQLAASQSTDLRVQVDQASMRAFRAGQFCVIQLRLANSGQKGIRSVHVEVATSSTVGLVEQDSPYIPPGSDELVTLRLKPDTAGQHEFRALLTTTSFTGHTSHFRTRPLVFAVARAHQAGGAQVYNMDLSAMQVGKIGNLGMSEGGQAGLGGQADWVAVPLSAISEAAAQGWRSKHGGAPKGPPPAQPTASSAPSAPQGLPDLFHLGPDGTSDAALPVKAVVAKILAAPDAVHNVWHDGFSAWKLWSDVPELTALVKTARQETDARRARLDRAKQEARREAEQEAALNRLRAERDREVAQIRAEVQREREQAEQQAAMAREKAERDAAQAREEADREIALARQQASGLTLRMLDFGQKKIAVIKVVRALTRLGLKDAKALVESCPAVIKQWDAPAWGDHQQAEQAADSLRAAGAQVELSDGGTRSVAQAESSVVLRLLDFGSYKIRVIKAVRAITSLGLKDAKALVDSAPSVIKEWDPAKDRRLANQGLESLRQAGAQAEVIESEAGPVLRLLNFGSYKIRVIKAVRAITGLGLKDAKTLVESAPTRVKEWDFSKQRRGLQLAADSLREAGAQVELDS